MKNKLIFKGRPLIKAGFALIIVLGFGLLVSKPLQAQERNIRQQESLLTARKWMIVEVKKNKLTKLKKMDGFRMEVGNELSLSIDHKFGYKNNDYEYMSGKWKLDGKKLLLIHDARDATNRLENSHFKIIKLSKTELFLKRLDKPKGKIVFK
ncbi:MAG: hypothetical protein DRI71_07915 [Bacteroidetes bacterium]|nr:MAG: hypothetical protein DRI71_07915 [Bacteroidota bacterium]